MSPAQVLLAIIVATILTLAPIVVLFAYCCCRKDVCHLRPKAPRPYKKLDEPQTEKNTELESTGQFEAEPLPDSELEQSLGVVN